MSTIYTEEYVDNLPADPIDALQTILKYFDGIINSIPEEEDFAVVLETYCLIYAYCKEHEITLTSLEQPDHVSDDMGEMIDRFGLFQQELIGLQRVREASSYSDRAAALVSKSTAYIFTDGDLENIQNLVNELRDHISNSTDLSDDHKRRLLKKLELLQAELHKRMSSLDRFWSLIPERAMILGQAGEDIKPLIDRIEQLVKIAGRVEARRAELPSDSDLRLLPEPTDED